MSISLFYSRHDGFYLGSATAISVFMDEIATFGSYPALVLRDCNEGWIHYEDQPVDLENTNLTETMMELEDLKAKPLSNTSREILEVFIEACEYAKTHKLDLEFA